MQRTFPIMAIVALVAAGCVAHTPDDAPVPAASESPVHPPWSTFEPDVPEVPVACIGEQEQKHLSRQMHDWMDNLEGKTFGIRMEGTMKGELMETLMFFDPTSKTMKIWMDHIDFRLAAHGSIYTVKMESEEAWGLNYHPDGAMAMGYRFFLDLVQNMTEDQRPPGGSLVDKDGPTLSCIQWDYQSGFRSGVINALQIRWSDPDTQHEMVISRQQFGDMPPGRLLYDKYVDPAMQTNIRTHYIYHDPDPVRRAPLPTPPAPFTYDLQTTQAYTNHRGGIYASATLGDHTHWVPINLTHLHLVDQSTGEVLYSNRLADREYDMGGGDYASYRDMDQNGYISPGDRFIFDLGPGVDVQLYDMRAGAYAMVGDFGAIMAQFR